MSKRAVLSALIREKAMALGFEDCGFAKVEELSAEARYLEAWLNQDRHGKMAYMANHFDKRINPSKLVEGVKSVISLSFNYFTRQKQKDAGAPKIAMYALGADYHEVVRARLEQLLEFIRQQAGAVSGRCFVDSAPVLEKAWAKRSGIGWIGKNTNLLTKRKGSYFFLAEIMVDLELEYDSPVKDYCGKCTKCIDACPTGALFGPYQLDASRCISYFTIELKDQMLPEAYKGKFNNWMYGCDICQQVCPINAQARPHQEPAFAPEPELLEMNRGDWLALQQDKFDTLFKHSAVKRIKYKRLKRNIDFLI